MKIYLDTSALVALYAKEETAESIAAVLQKATTTLPNISQWNLTEFSAAMAFKFYTSQISDVSRQAALTQFARAQTSSFALLPVTTQDFQRAATFANQADLRLRGGDALHLSIAAGRSLSILTLDKRMVAAANTLGIGIVPFD